VSGTHQLAPRTAASFKEISERDIKKVPTLRGKTVINLFYENSTRTARRSRSRPSALRRLDQHLGLELELSQGRDARGHGAEPRSDAPDAIILRHPCSGAPHFLPRT
jgi:aspartate carbamoyltransferase catalytic subunit